MIESIRFENFKVFEELDVKLAPLTGIVGPNASGKTSILEAVNYSILVATSGDPHQAKRKLKLEESPKELTERIKNSKPWTSHQIHTNNLKCAWTVTREGKLGDVIRQTESIAHLNCVLLQLDPSNLRHPSYSNVAIPSAKYDGTMFASALAYLALNSPDVFSLIQSRLREVIPGVRKVRFERSPLTVRELATLDDRQSRRDVVLDRFGDSLIFDMAGATNVPASLVSEGTILVLAILYFLTTCHGPAVILLDDIDHGLHPKAQRDLIGLIRKLMEIELEIQVIFTTHSPYLLDCLKPEEVLLTTLREDGSAVCGGLTEHPEFDRWKDEMRPGEMWSLFGEEWVADLERNRVH